MPRTVDHIVACHDLGNKRRAAGKPVWDRKIDIKSLLQQDPSNKTAEHAVALGQEISALLRARLPAALLDVSNDEFDSDLESIVAGFADLEGCSYALDEFNGRLDELYDWADLNRVWLG